jgi:hypothetical protein
MLVSSRNPFIGRFSRPKSRSLSKSRSRPLKGDSANNCARLFLPGGRWRLGRAASSCGACSNRRLTASSSRLAACSSRRATVGGGLTCERGLNLGCDVNGERHGRSFQSMSPPYPAAPPAVNQIAQHNLLRDAAYNVEGNQVPIVSAFGACIVRTREDVQIVAIRHPRGVIPSLPLRAADRDHSGEAPVDCRRRLPCTPRRSAFLSLTAHYSGNPNQARTQGHGAIRGFGDRQYRRH